MNGYSKWQDYIYTLEKSGSWEEEKRVSKDEGSFATRTFVAIWLLLVLGKYQRGQIPSWYLHSVGKNKAFLKTSTRLPLFVSNDKE